jgi:hypothetical protein
MPHIKPATVVEATTDEATKKVAGAAGVDSVPDAGAIGGAEQMRTYIKILGVVIYNITKIRI